MAAHAALAATRSPTSARLHSKAASKQVCTFSAGCGFLCCCDGRAHGLMAEQCVCVCLQRVDFADFSGLRPGSCSVSAAARETSFSDVLGAQLVARVRTSLFSELGTTYGATLILVDSIVYVRLPARTP